MCTEACQVPVSLMQTVSFCSTHLLEQVPLLSCFLPNRHLADLNTTNPLGMKVCACLHSAAAFVLHSCRPKDAIIM